MVQADRAKTFARPTILGFQGLVLLGGTTRRLTNQWNGPLTVVFVRLRRASAQPQRPLISDVRRRLNNALLAMFNVQRSDSALGRVPGGVLGYPPLE